MGTQSDCNSIECFIQLGLAQEVSTGHCYANGKGKERPKNVNLDYYHFNLAE